MLVTHHWCFRKAGANVDAADSQGNTALHLAALHGFADAVAALLSAGADVNKPRQDGRRPLHAAAEHGHTAALQLLLRAGATVDALSATGETPLLRAAQQGQLAVVDLLLLAGADPNVADNSGLRPLQAAARQREWEQQGSRKGCTACLVRMLSGVFRTVFVLQPSSCSRWQRDCAWGQVMVMAVLLL
jgi:hypothetical protein